MLDYGKNFWNNIILYKRVYNLILPFDLAIHLFDKHRVPIVMYSVEIWRYENAYMIENVENVRCDFLRSLFNLRKAPHHMVYSEAGRYPLTINSKYRIMNFWVNIVTGNTTTSTFK